MFPFSAHVSVKFKISRSTSNQMSAVFFDKCRHVTSTALQKRTTVNAEWYINIGLPKAFEAWTARRPNKQSRSGELRTLKLKSHLLRTQTLRVLPLKPEGCQYIAIHATLPVRDFFPANIYPSGPLTYSFPKHLPSLSCGGCG